MGCHKRSHAEENDIIRGKRIDSRFYQIVGIPQIKTFRTDQLWMVEYGDEIVHCKTTHRDDPFDGAMDNGEVMARHLGRANYLRVGGSVGSATLAELERQFDQIDLPGDSLFKDYD